MWHVHKLRRVLLLESLRCGTVNGGTFLRASPCKRVISACLVSVEDHLLVEKYLVGCQSRIGEVLSLAFLTQRDVAIETFATCSLFFLPIFP